MPIAPPGGFPRFGEEVGEGLTIGETIDMGGGSYTDPGGDPSGLIAERPPIKVGPVRPPLFEREIIPPILKGGPVDPGVIDQMVIVYGPDGTMYPSPGAARAAGSRCYRLHHDTSRRWFPFTWIW
jgi:hypothetical protein